MGKIAALRSGGQSGADRGAMDAATALGIPVVGWCPAGGWAEDLTEPPGVLALYPQMTETPSHDVIQRTEWNIRDSTCTIVFNSIASDTSPGTDAGFAFNEKYGIPHIEIWIDGPDSLESQLVAARTWLGSLNDDAIVVGIGGPRASEYPGIYDIVFDAVTSLLKPLE